MGMGLKWKKNKFSTNNSYLYRTVGFVNVRYACYQFRILRNLRIDIKDRLEEYSQSIEIDIHDCTQSQKNQLPPSLRFNLCVFLTFMPLDISLATYIQLI